MTWNRSLLFLLLAGCAAQAPVDSDGVDVTSPTTGAPVADRSSAPVVEPSAAPSATPLAAVDACVMLYECGCNSGCVTVDKPRVGFRDGDLVMVKTGNLKGKEVYVVNNKTATGGELWTVQQRDPKAGVQVCGGPASQQLLGYLCATSGLGPPHGCTTCDAE